ncbi:hypothetical protein C1J03_23770 (plasmid) [Sulfitobacter sp. SK012]|uniref:hypothetical protein n=1 Tax=Sulfitobacter sp. SK012 TaxID=1389005 RepID=UPI000E0ADD7A|nr:hypothetical protein [Sulfitobacter sp. SK012]AXI49134.1 hypothetical protein C1J03_23770 [Sulfitobacter sp. SK012]
MPTTNNAVSTQVSSDLHAQMINANGRIDPFDQIESQEASEISSGALLPFVHEDALRAINDNPMVQSQKPLAYLFLTRIRPGKSFLRFTQSDIEMSLRKLGMKVPRNLPDIPYQAQKKPMPLIIACTAHFDTEWIIEPMGGGAFCFKLVNLCKIYPDVAAEPKRITDSASAFIDAFELTEQARLELQVRENHLLDDFLGCEMSFVTRPPRGFIKNVGQVDFDALYVTTHEVELRRMATVQMETQPQPICGHKAARMLQYAAIGYPHWKTKGVIIQRLGDDRIAFFEVAKDLDGVRVTREEHYVPE